MRKRILAAVVGGGIGGYFLRLPLRFLEDIVMGWMGEGVEIYWQTIVGLFLTWGLPFIIVFGAIWFGYGLKNWLKSDPIKTDKTTATAEGQYDNGRRPKLFSPELRVTYIKHEFGVLGEGKFKDLSTVIINNGAPILSIEAEFHPTGPMRIEAVKLHLIGEPILSLNWEVQEYSDLQWGSPSNAFNVSGISPGRHDATLGVFANGEDWGSHPFTIDFPEVNSS